MKTISRPVAFALAIGCCLLWAGSALAGKIAIGDDAAPGWGPFRAAFFRFGIAGLLLGAWGLWRDPDSLRVSRDRWRTDGWALGRVGLLGICLTYVFNYGGIALSNGTFAALIMATEPVWIAVLAVVFLKERLTRPRLAGIVLGMAGTLLVVTAGGARPDQSRALMLGNVLVVVSLLFEAGAVLTVKRLTSRYKGRAILTYEFLIGAVLLTPFALWETARLGPLAVTSPAWWAFAYLLGPCTLIAYTVWFRLLEMIDASELTVFIFLQPVVGAFLGVYFRGDALTTQTVVGACFVLAGMAAILRQKASANVEAAPPTP